MYTLALSLLLMAKLTTSEDKMCDEWKSTNISNRVLLSNSQWERVYIYFVAEENDVRFDIMFNDLFPISDLELSESYAYYMGEIYYKGTLHGGCTKISPKCTSYFNFKGNEYEVGDSHVNSLSISSQSLVYYLKCNSIWVLPRMPVSRGNLSLPSVKPTEAPDQDLCEVLNLGLGIGVIVLFLTLLFVCIVGWRARQSASSGKGDASPCHDSENSIYGMTEMPSMRG
ncbi:uncharacterized protein LOC122265395 isoform X2 [Penaeus japonicus]|uniref:uncharacterized protein LOC122265395 isoform X2 n=1 Tax=Penaeus japonicus TaxID=27405 RepID=UPI001C717535|nr:uncharacterized protein LOC122265395 isoform X2 [Penaeus japonicus]